MVKITGQVHSYIDYPFFLMSSYWMHSNLCQVHSDIEHGEQLWVKSIVILIPNCTSYGSPLEALQFGSSFTAGQHELGLNHIMLVRDCDN
jgi:hypothetical protein